MRRDVANAQTNANALDAVYALRHQRYTVTIGIDHRLRRGNAVARDQQLAVTRRRVVGKLLIDLIDFQDRATEIVAVLLVAAANRLRVVERQADLVLPERKCRRRIVGGKADVDARFCQLHGGSPKRPAPPRARPDYSGRRYVTQVCATTMRWRRARRIALPCPTS